MISNSCYAMTNVSYSKRRSWKPVPNGVYAHVQTGTRFGVLTISVHCECCDRHSVADFFFTLDEGDHVRERLFRMKTYGPLRCNIRFLNGVLGRFQHRVMSPDGFHDAYILQILASSEENNPTVEHLFCKIRTTIAQRRAFRNLYFRVFRRAFAPGGNQARRLVDEYDRAWKKKCIE